MASPLVGDREMSQSAHSPHVAPEEIAAYVDRAVTSEARARIQAHLAACHECRAEVMDVSRMSHTLSGSRGVRHTVIPAAAAAAAAAAVAAAAVVLMLVWPRDVRELEMREAPITTTISPRALAPVGAVDSVPLLVWSAVPSADRYQVRLFDTEGTLIWDRETMDTTAVVPARQLRPGLSYFWKVEAQTGFGRSVSTELTEFTIRGVPRR